MTTLTDDGVKVVASPDYNTITDPGFYHCNISNAKNGPGYASKLTVFAENKNSLKHLTQFAIPIYNTSNLCPAIRYMNLDGVWSEWEKIALTESNENFTIGEYLALHSVAVRGETPSSVKWSYIALQDANSGQDETKRLGMFGHRSGSDGSLRVRVHCYPKEVGTDVGDAYIDVGYTANGNIYTYVPTPSNDNNGNDIVNTHWVRKFISDISRSNVVHATGDETISGQKTFEDSPVFNNAPILKNSNNSKYIHFLSNYDKSANPEENQNVYVRLLGNTTTSSYVYTLAQLTFSYSTNGNSTASIAACNTNEGKANIESLSITYDKASDSFITHAPHPVMDSNDNSIATTGWVNNKIDRDRPEAYITETWSSGVNWYRVWSDGWIEQGGSFGPVGSEYTHTLLKPFKDTNYSLISVMRDQTGTNLDNWFSCSKVSNNSFITRSFKASGTWEWEAKGY